MNENIKEKRRIEMARWVAKIKADPERHAKYMQQCRECSRRKRARIHADPNKREEYLAKARFRAKLTLAKTKMDPIKYAERLARIRKMNAKTKKRLESD